MKNDLADEKVTRHDGSQENSLPPMRGEGRGGGNSQHKPRPCGCNTRKLVNNRFPALKGWGLRGNNSQSLINDKHFTHFTHLIHLTHFKKAAFTLAEVLITLGVIGIVAAMTIPTVMNKYQQKVTETRLMKFYSVMNNAIQLSEIDNGDKTTWYFGNEFCSTSGNYSEKCLVDTFEKFFKPYLKISNYEYIQDFDKVNSHGALLVNFPDGSAAAFTWADKDIIFYPIGANATNANHQLKDKDYFNFGLYPMGVGAADSPRYKYHRGKGMLPYVANDWDGTEENAPCLRKTQLNGWKFPDECNPWK